MLSAVWKRLVASPLRGCRLCLLAARFVQDLQLELEAARLRLLRRSQIIDVLRKAYVRDVVTIKAELARKATMTDGVRATQAYCLRVEVCLVLLHCCAETKVASNFKCFVPTTGLLSLRPRRAVATMACR